MKKTLLLASAAVLFAGSASAMEKGLELGIEGYASAYGVYANQEDAGDNRSEFGIKKEMELAFTGETMLDNGLTVGVTVETDVEDDDVSGENEAYLYVEGGFGKVIAGAEYNAAYLMQVAAPAVDAEFDGMDPTYNVVSVGSNEVEDQSYAMFGEGDDQYAGADKATYISPIWEGLQVGVSYTTDTATEGDRGEMTNVKADDAYSVAARYAAEDVLGADWAFGAGWNKTTFANEESIDEWNVGVNAAVDAWDLGASYYEEENDESGSDTTAIAVGVNYETGAFNYGASYLYKEVGDDDELDRYMAGVNYAYGPGMTLNGSVSYNDYSADVAAQENSATVVAIGTVINF